MQVMRQAGLQLAQWWVQDRTGFEAKQLLQWVAKAQRSALGAAAAGCQHASALRKEGVVAVSTAAASEAYEEYQHRAMILRRAGVAIAQQRLMLPASVTVVTSAYR